MKNILLFTLILFAVTIPQINAQDLGDFKPKDNSYKQKKINSGLKKVYISNFNINFEIYKETVDNKKAGGFRNTIKNASKAKAAIGLSSLDKEALQQKADQLYDEFVADLKSKGYTIITADEAGQTEVYNNWKKASGPTIFETDMTGILSVIPTNHSFYYKERTAMSKTIDGFAKTDQNLSKELGDALIANVSLIYVFSETGMDWNIGNQAKAKLFVNFRLANSYTVSDAKTSTGLSSMVDKSKQSVGLSSYVNFTRGKLKIGGSPESSYNGYMKSDLDINNVLPKEKVVAYSTQTQATATLANPVVMIRGSNYSERTKWLEPDGKKYANGMFMAGKTLLDYHLKRVMD